MLILPTQMTRRVEWSLFAMGLLFAFSCVWRVYPNIFWHDQQRVAQILLLVSSAAVFIALKAVPVSRTWLSFLVLCFLFGLLSTFFASNVAWAARELAKSLGLVLLALTVASVVRARNRTYFVCYLVAIPASLLALQFVATYLSAFISDLLRFDLHLMFGGFENPRFFGQFQVFALPVLSMLSVQSYSSKRLIVYSALLGVHSVHWCMAFLLGGRGLLLSVLLAHALVATLRWRTNALLKESLLALILGGSLYLLMFSVLPEILDVDITNPEVLRGGLSRRAELWRWAWEMSVAHPWLGVGPMHFASFPNPIAAHPHQVVLQLASEWGWVVTGAFALIATGGFLRAFRAMSEPADEAVDTSIWLALIGAVILAQVDGILVMPYAETWFAIFVGLGIARWGHAGATRLASGFKLAAAVTITVLVCVLVIDLVIDPKVSGSIIDPAPRFWSWGWIPVAH